MRATTLTRCSLFGGKLTGGSRINHELLTIHGDKAQEVPTTLTLTLTLTRARTLTLTRARTQARAQTRTRT